MISIIEERCKGCGLCIVCPKGLIIMSDKFNSKGYRLPKLTKPKECINCGMCYEMCPDVAIVLEDKDD